jgi:hypothetical protein
MSQQYFTDGDSGEEVKTVIDANFTELYNRDASGYGFSTSATASVNVSALQSALDVGGTITINTPGDYEINDTLYIGSNTKLICCPGVAFKKTGNFSNVILNKGALTRTYNENIHIQGLTIKVNSVDNTADLDVDGLRGQVGFYYVRHLNFHDFRCEDLGSAQYCIHIIKWEYIHLKNITIEGEKDGINLSVGHDGVFENMNFATEDDAISIYSANGEVVTIEVGDVYNLTFRDCVDNVSDGTGFTCRIMVSAWDDWTLNNTYQSGDICVNAGNAYINANEYNDSDVGTVAPTHSSGKVTGADGITWKYLNACDFYYTEIYNVTFDNCTYYDERTPLYVVFLDNEFMRSVYPGTETLPSVHDIKFINSTFSGPPKIVTNGGNLKDLIISNCVINQMTSFVIQCPDQYADSNPQMNVIFTNNLIKNISDFFVVTAKDGQEVYITAHGNTKDDSTITFFKSGTATIRFVNSDLIIPDAELSDLDPSIGDICRTTSGLQIYKSTGWVNLAT